MNIVAELIVTDKGKTFIVQVPADASFSSFYLWSREVGQTFRVSGRNNSTRSTVTLEEIAKKFQTSKINYYDRTEYERLISCPPDELPGGVTKIQPQHIMSLGEMVINSQPAPVRITDAQRERERSRAEMFGWKESHV